MSTLVRTFILKCSHRQPVSSVSSSSTAVSEQNVVASLCVTHPQISSLLETVFFIQCIQCKIYWQQYHFNIKTVSHWALKGQTSSSFSKRDTCKVANRLQVQQWQSDCVQMVLVHLKIPLLACKQLLIVDLNIININIWHI